MDLFSIKSICNGYFNKKKSYTVEIDNYKEDAEHIEFDVRILKNGYFRAVQSMYIIKTSELTATSQLNSQIGRFSAEVINNLI